MAVPGFNIRGIGRDEADVREDGKSGLVAKDRRQVTRGIGHQGIEIAGGRNSSMCNNGTIYVGQPAIVRTKNGEVMLFPVHCHDRDKANGGCGDEKDIVEDEGVSRIHLKLDSPNTSRIDMGPPKTSDWMI